MRMRRIMILLVVALALLLCLGTIALGQDGFRTARAQFVTTLVARERTGGEAPTPPDGLLEKVAYDAPPGKLAAYVSPDPGDGKKHPAILWVTGGFDNSIGDVWTERDRSNDQSASALFRSGIITMYPSFRGGNENPGYIEILYGEVEDLLAARDYLASLAYVDPARIYLGGHSTGGTLALLAAESSDGFAGVFALGPVSAVSEYGTDGFPFKASNLKEIEMRSPILWLADIKTPTFVLEGTGGNYVSLLALQWQSKNPKISFCAIEGEDHFTIIAPLTELIAKKVLAGEAITFAQEELVF